MDHQELNAAFADLSTPLVSDACIRLEVPQRLAPAGICPVIPGSHLAGPVLPARHCGSVDVFLEAMGDARPGDILVIDNDGRRDEGCIGDLTALEARACGLAGMLVWGCHRDTADLLKINYPVFSYGTCPAGPRRLDSRDAETLTSARFGDVRVTSDDVAFADADGVLFVPAAQARALLATAQTIRETERRQAQAIRDGNTLRRQFKFDQYLARRAADPEYTFRNHLRDIGGAIEE